MTTIETFADTACSLGEGPLWHPLRSQLFWFDINQGTLNTRIGLASQTWHFKGHVSAAGWVDQDTLLIADETSLRRFNISTGLSEQVCALEADNPITRTNDGRADPQGGFWIGTMGKSLEPGAGAIYRYYRGELRRLYAPWTVPNATCFAPDGGHAYFTDTPTGRIWRQRLNGDGWPSGEPHAFLDLDPAHYRPDGAVIDADGRFWCAHYGHAKLTCHGPDGIEQASYALPARQTTCPAFAGAGSGRLFITSAAHNLTEPTKADGTIATLVVDARGQAEHRVVL